MHTTVIGSSSRAPIGVFLAGLATLGVARTAPALTPAPDLPPGTFTSSASPR
jgi:hypothetical protein